MHDRRFIYFTKKKKKSFFINVHGGYMITDRKPASNCFFTSSLIFFDMSGCFRLSFCLTGGHSSLSGKWCTTMSVSSPGMS